MANVQSPPGLLNIFEVLREVGIGPVSLEVSSEIDKTPSGYEDNNYSTIHTMVDTCNIRILECLLNEKKYPVNINLAHIRFSIHANKRQQFLQTGICPKETV